MADDRIQYEGGLCTIGRFRCPPGDADWRAENRTSGAIFVFPTMPVEIAQADREPVVADRNQIMFYNGGQPYRRRMLCARGDDAVWFMPDADLLLEVLAVHEPEVRERREEPFRFTCGPSPAGAYGGCRTLCHELETRAHEPMAIEETCIALLERAVTSAYSFVDHRLLPRRRSTAAAHREIVMQAQTLMATRPEQPWTLAELARATHVSIYHFCRVFRSMAGMSAYAYLTQLRLRAALDRLIEDDIEIGVLGLELGFGSHSHFTDTFRGTFGLSPKRFRSLARRRSAREMSRILEARGQGVIDH